MPRILLIEDERNLARIVRQRLEEDGYQRPAGSGRRATAARVLLPLGHQRPAPASAG